MQTLNIQWRPSLSFIYTYREAETSSVLYPKRQKMQNATFGSKCLLSKKITCLVWRWSVWSHPNACERYLKGWNYTERVKMKTLNIVLTHQHIAYHRPAILMFCKEEESMQSSPLPSTLASFTIPSELTMQLILPCSVKSQTNQQSPVAHKVAKFIIGRNMRMEIRLKSFKYFSLKSVSAVDGVLYTN